MTDRTKIGSHELSYEAETGFLVYVQNGRLSDTEAPLLREAILRYVATYYSDKPCFALFDCRNGQRATTEARKTMASRWPDAFEAHVVMFGASLVLRSFANLGFMAARLASSKLNLTAVATEDEARALLTEQKRAYDARKASQ